MAQRRRHKVNLLLTGKADVWESVSGSPHACSRFLESPGKPVESLVDHAKLDPKDFGTTVYSSMTRLDLARVDGRTAAVARRDPWAAIKKFIDAHGYEREENWYGGETCKVDVVHGSSRATLVVGCNRLFTGELIKVDVNSTVVAPKAKDPPDAFSHGLSIAFERKEARVCQGYVNLISKKPTHGVRSGNDALGMAIAIGRIFGCIWLELQDASSLPCAGVDGSINLRKLRILSKGAGWYESKGFRSIVEALEPGKFAGTVGRLHSIPLKDLLRALRGIDAAARAALCDPPNSHGMRIASYKLNAAEPVVISGPPSTLDVIAMLQNASAALEAFQKITHASTLGNAVDRLIQKDCMAADRLIHALFPTSAFKVMLSGPDGGPVEPLPRLEAWVFAWRLVSSFGTANMRLEL
ncbi:hypothetical protein CEUSTIGMA_g13881.t1 [Chlamydomonas eustigma]|uniref:Uncharacterized protein n=1 Tax=Chlamydomonas eustigma TaxID=1157962 RepID=A0A250XTR7_9CHLO|nr:hypothetical protein CEUSTIGMA_g13881.t1 [Chlamydomonas eustigma]|eukprot:GAX86471.1 hypothetical protein CEUSTIGMA_g13881.t1 [Chlamydomonas eustigma]